MNGVRTSQLDFFLRPPGTLCRPRGDPPPSTRPGAGPPSSRRSQDISPQKIRRFEHSTHRPPAGTGEITSCSATNSKEIAKKKCLHSNKNSQAGTKKKVEECGIMESWRSICKNFGSHPRLLLSPKMSWPI